MATTESGGAGRLRAVLVGTDDPRVRATWRVLLAMPVLWVLTGGVLAGNVQTAIGAVPAGRSAGAGLALSVLHAGFLLLALAGWARYLDRRPLSSYGVSASPDWVRDALLGAGAVVLGQAVWIGLGALAGGKTVHVSPSPPEGSVLGWLIGPLIALGLHAAVQQVVFFRVILKNAAEGLHARGLSAGRAALAAVPVAVVFFVLMHGSTTPLRVLDLAIVGGVFGLMYLHTGELALGIGAHFGAFYSGTVVFAVVEVSGSFAGVLGAIDQYGFPKMVLAYLVVAAWLAWRRDGLPLESAVARWRPA